jgi:cytochrome c-type biogenesis protein CcmE
MLRIGGLVEPGSVERAAGDPQIRFRVTDMANTVPVVYAGLLPDLFREGQGVVANGKLGADGVFRAAEILARHDETYMPPEVAEALKRSGHWQHAGPDGKKPAP